MAHSVELKASTREILGKASKRLAHDGMTPAVVYGREFGVTPVAIESRAVEHLLQEATVGSTLVLLTIDGGAVPVEVIVRDVVRDPVRGLVQHLDLWAVNLTEIMQTSVPVVFVGTAAGERTGGVTMHATHELRVEARPRNLPDHIEVDASALEVGDSMTVGDLIPPAGVVFLDDAETVLCSVMRPTAAEEVIAEVTGEVPEVGRETAGSEE